VENREVCGIEKDRDNGVTFEPVTTSRLRLEVVLPAHVVSGHSGM